MTRPLDPLTILITRPKQQAASLQQNIETLGGKVLLLPTITIVATTQLPSLQHCLADLAQFDIAIFISANAVHHSVPHWPSQPAHLQSIAVGPATAAALAEFGITAHVPAQWHSEGLLAMPELQQCQGKKIVIFCGEKTKAKLPETLQQRGATVTLAHCYQRQCPPTIERDTLQHLQRQSIDIIISTSATSLTHLVQMLGPAHFSWLQSIPILVISPEMVTLCQDLQLHQPVIQAENATDQAIVAALLQRKSVSQ